MSADAKIPGLVIDTNIWVSSFLSDMGFPARIRLAAMQGKFTPLYTPAILAEYMDVLSRPRFGFPREAVVGFITRLLENGAEVAPVEPPARLPDVDDEVFLAAALGSTDKIVVTGNTKHFPSAACRPVRVLTPAEALRLLQENIP